MKKKITDKEILKVFLRKDGNIDSNKLKEKFINENQEYFIYLNDRYKNSLGYSYKEIINAIKNNVKNLDLRHFEQNHKLTDEDIKLIFNNFVKFNNKTIKKAIENDYNLENYLLNRYKNNPFDKNMDDKYNYIFKVVKLIQNNYDKWPICSYNGINFDSSDELAFYIYYNDKGSNIKLNTKRFIYYFKNIECRYIPDFEVNGQFIEIKGEHFLDKETDKWINPFRDPKWTDEEYQEECDKYEAKHQCAIANNVKIIYDCKEYKKYVENIYGRGFIEACKKKK